MLVNEEILARLDKIIEQNDRIIEQHDTIIDQNTMIKRATDDSLRYQQTVMSRSVLVPDDPWDKGR